MGLLPYRIFFLKCRGSEKLSYVFFWRYTCKAILQLVGCNMCQAQSGRECQPLQKCKSINKCFCEMQAWLSKSCLFMKFFVAVTCFNCNLLTVYWSQIILLKVRGKNGPLKINAVSPEQILSSFSAVELQCKR